MFEFENETSERFTETGLYCADRVSDRDLIEEVIEHKAHPHAELMAQYAEDAKTTDKPWELWEYRYSSSLTQVWYECKAADMAWWEHRKYRRKPQKRVYKKWVVLWSDGSHSSLFDDFDRASANIAPSMRHLAEIREIPWGAKE